MSGAAIGLESKARGRSWVGPNDGSDSDEQRSYRGREQATLTLRREAVTLEQFPQVIAREAGLLR
jgi:hypothetical protein